MKAGRNPQKSLDALERVPGKLREVSCRRATAPASERLTDAIWSGCIGDLGCPGIRDRHVISAIGPALNAGASTEPEVSGADITERPSALGRWRQGAVYGWPLRYTRQGELKRLTAVLMLSRNRFRDNFRSFRFEIDVRVDEAMIDRLPLHSCGSGNLIKAHARLVLRDKACGEQLAAWATDLRRADRRRSAGACLPHSTHHMKPIVAQSHTENTTALQMPRAVLSGSSLRSRFMLQPKRVHSRQLHADQRNRLP